MVKANTPRETVSEYLEAWQKGDVFGMFAELHLSVRFRITAAELLSKLTQKPIGYTVFDDEDAKNATLGKLDGTMIRDVNIGIDFGMGEKPAKIRCVCEKIGYDSETKLNTFRPAPTTDGGRWGVNPNSLRIEA